MVGTGCLLGIIAAVWKEGSFKAIQHDSIMSLNALVVVSCMMGSNYVNIESADEHTDGIDGFAILVVTLSFGLSWFRWRFVPTFFASLACSAVWLGFGIDRQSDTFWPGFVQLILFLILFLTSSHQHERSLRKEFKTRRNDSFKVQVLQDKVEALQTGEDKDETDGLDMTGRAQKAILSLQALAENPHLSAEDKQKLLLVKKTLLSSNTFDVDIKRQLEGGKGAGMHSETKDWLSSQFNRFDGAFCPYHDHFS